MPSSTSHNAIKVLFVTPEVYPLCKTGGLGDVSAALPVALRELSVDIRLLLPGYPSVLAGLKYKRKVAIFDDLSHFPSATLLSAKLRTGNGRSATSLPVYIIDCPALYQREGGPYLDTAGNDWPDNAVRFGLLSKIAAILACDTSPLTWQPAIVHCNDWQSGIAPAYLHFHSGKKAASLMTIHNLAFQGCFPPSMVAQLGLPARSFDVNGVEYYGNLSFIKAGIFYADHITTVSPSYAREIQQAPLGFGLQGLLATRRQDISGIVNGIDTVEWDPATDPYLSKNYSTQNLSAKISNKLALQQKMGLTSDKDRLLFAAISRFSEQKGYDLILEAAPQLAQIPSQLVVLGNGDTVLEEDLAQLAKNYPGQVAVHIGFDEGLSHLIEAGADCFLMPSRFEPCGLNQMYSQHYGTPPLVHATGGLIDTVVDCTASTLADGTASGFQFHDMTAEAFLEGIQRVVTAYHDKAIWQQLQKNGMRKDFSWRTSAMAYRAIYQSLLAKSQS